MANRNNKMLKKFFTLLVLFFVVFSVFFCSCSKSKEKGKIGGSTEKTDNGRNEDKAQYLLDGLAIGGLNINDTTNGISARLLFPVIRNKDFKYDVKPVIALSEEYFRAFVEKAKKRGKIDGSFHQYVIRTVFVNVYEDIFSVLMQQRFKMADEKDFVEEYYAFNCKSNQKTDLSFTDVLNVNETNYKDFQKLFSGKLDSVDLKLLSESDFAFGRDSLFVFVDCGQGEGLQLKAAAPMNRAKRFVLNGR